MENHLLLSTTCRRSYHRWLAVIGLFIGVAVGQVVAQPTAFRTEDVTFSSAGVTLVGTMLIPKHPVAAVVLVHGSGPEKRMLELAARLAGRGIAVLTYDKRGVGASGGVYVGPEVGTNNVEAANLDLLAVDASAAITALAARLPARHGPVGLAGGSQAGWVVPLAAQKKPGGVLYGAL